MDEAIRQGIFAGESGGDYDALFGFSNREGGPFAHIRPSTMTIDDVINFQSPKGEYAAWVRPQVGGRTATPVGAYQVVGDTLKAAKAGLGLTGKELYDQATQDMIGDWVLKTQGTGAWTGYKGPKAKASGLRHVGGAGSGPKYFAPKTGAGGGGQYTLTEPGPDKPKDKPKSRGQIAGEGLKAMADAMGGAIQDPTSINTPVNQDMGGGAPMASFFRPQLMPTAVQAGAGGMGGVGQPDMRQLLALLMQGG